MAAPLHVVILAAGEGKRMKSALPRCCSRSRGGRCWRTSSTPRARCGRRASMSSTDMAASRCARPSPIRPTCDWARAGATAGHRPCGAAGHAGRARRRARAGAVRRRAADHAPIRCARLLASPGRARGAGRRTGRPTGYGRIVRDAEGRVARDRRAQGCRRRAAPHPHRSTPASSPPTPPRCRRWLAALSNDNAQGEYYLTDVFAHGRGRIHAPRRWWRCADPIEAEGANDPWQLAAARARLPAARGARAVRCGACASPTRRASIIRGDVASAAMSKSMSTWCSKARSSSATACASDRSAA